MSYSPTDWVDNVTPVDAARMDNLEAGVVNAHAAIPLKVDKDAVETASARLLAAKLLAGDANQSFKIRGDGQLEWGAGGASALDTNLYRSGANTLKTDDWFYVTGNILVGAADVNLYRAAADILASDDKFDPASLNVQTKAGVPVDGDVVGGAANGDLIVDATNKKLYVRIAGVWEQVGGGGGAAATQHAIDFRNPNLASTPGNLTPAVNALTGWEAWAWSFRQDVLGQLYGIARLPADAVLTSPKLVLELAASAAGNTVIDVYVHGVADGESLAISSWDFTSLNNVVTLATSRARKKVEIAVTGLAVSDLVVVQVAHNGVHASDTLAAATELYGGWLSTV